MARTIKADHSNPLSVSLTAGQIEFAIFGIYLFEADKITFRTIAIGSSTNGNGDEIVVAPGGSLSGKFLTWDVKAVPLSGTRFSVTLRAFQDGKTIASFLDVGDVPAGQNEALIRASAIFT